MPYLWHMSAIVEWRYRSCYTLDEAREHSAILLDMRLDGVQGHAFRELIDLVVTVRIANQVQIVDLLSVLVYLHGKGVGIAHGDLHPVSMLPVVSQYLLNLKVR